jgi:Uma2 family endonuclease
MTTTVGARKQRGFEPGLDLVDGVLVTRNGGYACAHIATTLGWLLDVHARASGLGYVFGSNAGYQYPALDNGRLKFPDVSVVLAERLTGGVPKGWANFPPDLVIEVVSPNDQADELQQKVGQWLAGGVRLVWVVYTEAREVVVHHPDRHSQTLVLGEELSGEDVVPGFRVAVAELFEGL